MKKLVLLLLVAAHAAAFPLVDRTPGPTPFYPGRPALASRGDEGLAVWQEGLGDFRAIRVGSQGQPLDATAMRIGRADLFAPPAVASDGRDYLVAWVTKSELWLAVIRDGRTVERITSTAADTLSSPEVVWAGTSYVVMIRDTTTARVLAVDRSGAVTADAVAVSAPRGIADATIAASGSVAALLWIDRVSHNVARVDVSPEQIRGGTVAQQTNASGDAAAGEPPMTVAAAGSGNGFLAVWTDRRFPISNDAMHMVYRALNAAAQPIGDRGETPLEPVEERAAIGWNGGSFTVVWASRRDGNRAVLAIRVGADGKPIDAAPRTITTIGQETFGASGSAVIGGNVVVVFRTLVSSSLIHNSTEVAALAFTPSLALAGDAAGTVLSRILPDEKAAGAAWAGDHWVAVWSERREVDRIAVGRITPQGERLDPAGVLLDPVPSVRRSQAEAAIASSGAESLAVWIDLDRWDNAMLRGAIIDAGRGPLHPRPITISFDAISGASPSVAWNGEAYVVAWRTKGRYIAAVRMNRNGDLLDPVPIILTETHPSFEPGDARPLLAARGDELLLVWQRGIAVPSGTGLVPNVFYDLLAQRFSRALTPVGSSRYLSIGAADTVSAELPALAAGPDGYLITWNQNTWTPYYDPAHKATLVAVLLDAAAEKSRVLLLGDTDATRDRAVAWHGGAFLLAHERTLLTIAPDAHVVSRTPLAVQTSGVAQSLEGGGPSPLLLVTSEDLDESTPDEAFLLTPPRRRSTSR